MNFEEKIIERLKRLEREVERLRVKERPAGGSGVTDHGALTGLSDNDHPQYLLTTGKAADSDKLDGNDSTFYMPVSYKDGWIPVSSTWTYASATTINVPSGAAAIYKVGQGLKLKHNGAQKWFYITAVADTQLTITGGSDYPFISSGSNTLSEISYTNTPDTAIGFPGKFQYTPTGISASNVTLSGSFSVSANRCWVSFLARFTGPITYTGAPTLPIPVGNVFPNYFGTSMSLTSSTGGYFDSGIGSTLGSLFVTALSGSTTFNIYSASGALLSATSPITWANNDGIRIEFSYPI